MPSRPETRAGAECVAHERVHRPSVAELAGQPDEPVGDQPDAQGGHGEGQRAARPSAVAAATPVTDMASVGAITPTDTEDVSRNRSSRRRPGRETGPLERGWALLSWRVISGSPGPGSPGEPAAVGDQHGTGDVGGLGRAEPYHGRGDLLRFRDAAQRHRGEQLITDGRRHPGAGHPGRRH